MSLPLRKSEVRPFQVRAVRITAGQNGATKGDQSADLMSYIATMHVIVATYTTWTIYRGGEFEFFLLKK